MLEEVKDFVILAVIYSSLVELSYFGIAGRPFEVVVFPMVPMYDVLQRKKYLVTPENFRVGG